MSRHSLRRERALILADGFYEWKAEPRQSRKVPYCFTWPAAASSRSRGSGSIGMGPRAGRLLRHSHGAAERVGGRGAQPHAGHPAAEAGGYMDRTLTITDPAMLAPALEPQLAADVVSTRVNAMPNDDKECIRPVA